MTEDGQLLARFAKDHSEEAFVGLVRRHIDLVYSVATRVLGGDRHLAKDVTQQVFIHLARQARRLPLEVRLAGWLHRHASFTASKLVRGERRRTKREAIAMEIKSIDDGIDSDWESVAPRLDECLNEMSHDDRDSIVLRYLKGQNLRSVGLALGVSEDAAQKRVSRALVKLRIALRSRGLSGIALTSVLAANAVVAAPPSLVGLVASNSVSAVAASGVSWGYRKS